jgi:alanine racemase
MVNGQRTIILGRVSMDMLAVDLTNIDNVMVGAEVELWGEKLNASDIAMYCDTIAYSLFTGITRRVHKVYKNIINRNSPNVKNSEDASNTMPVKIAGTVAS